MKELDKATQEVFEFLDGLREIGSTNMMGAAPSIVNQFDVSREVARKLLLEWMETFVERHPEDQEIPDSQQPEELLAGYTAPYSTAEFEDESYKVELEITVDASLFDDATQVELWIESQLSKDPDVALATAVSAEVL